MLLCQQNALSEAAHPHFSSTDATSARPYATRRRLNKVFAEFRYLTNTELEKEDVVRQYHGLWVVERAFRIGKGQLEMRPMFHFTEKRIEAHICICFVAYKMYKELERNIRQLGIPMSVDKVLSVAKTITIIRLRLPNGELYTETLYTTPQQEAIRPLIDPDFV